MAVIEAEPEILSLKAAKLRLYGVLGIAPAYEALAPDFINAFQHEYMDPPGRCSSVDEAAQAIRTEVEELRGGPTSVWPERELSAEYIGGCLVRRGGKEDLGRAVSLTLLLDVLEELRPALPDQPVGV